MEFFRGKVKCIIVVKENVDNQENKFIILKNNKKIIILTVLFANLVADMQNDTLQLEYKSDILEDNILSISDTLLARLLKDNTTTPENAGDDFSKWNNIIWATEDYASKGEGFGFSDQITKEKITGENGMVIRPRALKSKDEQTARAKNMAEIFTPAWVCNAQINLCDNTWFGRENVFNTENYDTYSWTTNHNKIEFPEDKTWQDYLYDRRLEITCGEAP